MKIGILKETKLLENRVALTPETIKQLIKTGFEVLVEYEAGEKSCFPDESFKAAGAGIAEAKEVLNCDIILKVNAPTPEEVQQMKEGAVCISFLYAYTRPDLLEIFAAKKITSFAMDAVPRISKAQKMDALSSQANIAGYKAVILAANASAKMFPLMMTAAGTVTPAKVLIFGAGVAGLQAIATAKRLGAVVEVSDVRPETKEQVESLGGRFLTVEDSNGVKVQGGYAKEVSAEFLQKQKELIQNKIKEADIVITTALVIGKKSPVLVTEEMVKTMKTGAVIVDLAVESGGNCELSRPDETVVRHGVTIIGASNLSALLPLNASQLYAVNISTLLLHLCTADRFNLDMEDEITKGTMITYQGELVHDFTRSVLEKQASMA